MKENKKEETDKYFNQGKLYLDSGCYLEAIRIFDNLILGDIDFLSDQKVKVLLETSYNNRGVAKCNLAIQKKDIDLFKEGMLDFEESIEINKRNNEVELHGLTAHVNLVTSKRLLSQFNVNEENIKGTDFTCMF